MIEFNDNITIYTKSLYSKYQLRIYENNVK